MLFVCLGGGGQIIPHSYIFHLIIFKYSPNKTIVKGSDPQFSLFYTMREKKKKLNEPITQEGWNCIIKNIHDGFTEQH